MVRVIILIILFFIPELSLSQNGIIRGTLKDKLSQEGLPFANIIVKELGTGTTTDFEGNYNLEVQPGNYSVEFSYVGYESIVVTDVTINEGAIYPLSVSLEYESELLEGVVVTAAVIADNESALLSVQRKSPNLLDGITAENFKKIGDGDAAAAIKRVPGVSIQGGKYVFVRGLGDRYTKTILNGLDIPGLDPDRNTLQMDIFPTNLIKNIVILKSSSADLPADFTGGIVNIETKDFPEEKEFNISVSGTYNPSMHFKDNFPYYDGSQTDWLGFDNGMREVPIDRRTVIPQTVDQDPILTSITDSFDPNLASKIGNSSMNFGLGITYGNQYNLKSGNTLGLIGSFNIKN
ncbi:MAG: carboxypeptidase-like regulatory domain-containing protein, partial [Cytophagales bacterium]